MATINLDGVEYDTDKLSDVVKQNITMLQLTEQEIQKLQAKLAIAQTARNTYAQTIKQNLPTAQTPVQALGDTLKFD